MAAWCFAPCHATLRIAPIGWSAPTVPRTYEPVQILLDDCRPTALAVRLAKSPTRGACNMKRILAISLFLVLWTTGTLEAALISYVEPPDLGDQSSPTPLGSLDVGTNTVAGTICFATGSCPFDLDDTFQVDLPAG